MTRRVCIVLLNWNGWKDTIECLESVFRNSYPDYQVVVCDNGSTDQSLDRIKAWVAGSLAADVRQDHPLYHLSAPPVPKPIRDNGLVLIDNVENVGFAKGNNAGIRHALQRTECAYVWLLNNDTVIEPDALVRMVERMEETPSIGMCGSTLRFYDDPGIVQHLGGATFNRWLAATRGIGGFTSASERADRTAVERQMDCVLGPSLLVSRSFLETIGLLSEDYFIFYEEIDWAVRARGRYTLGFAPGSVVYHKHGRSIGSSSDPRTRSATADYYGLRNRLVFTRKFFPWALPTVYLGVVAALFRRMLRGQWDRVGMVWKVLWTA